MTENKIKPQYEEVRFAKDLENLEIRMAKFLNHVQPYKSDLEVPVRVSSNPYGTIIRPLDEHYNLKGLAVRSEGLDGKTASVNIYIDGNSFAVDLDGENYLVKVNYKED